MPATPVLLADGTTAPIAALAVGASVVAADPVTGEAGDREVVATHISTGVKQLVEVTVNPASEKQPNPLGAPVDQSGDSGSDEGDDAAFDADGPVVATDNHEFWVADLDQWLAAGALAPGMWLQTSAGTWVQISVIRSWTASDQVVHNLTVADLHTYHVGVGTTPVLVHNCGDSFPIYRTPKSADKNFELNHGPNPAMQHIEGSNGMIYFGERSVAAEYQGRGAFASGMIRYDMHPSFLDKFGGAAKRYDWQGPGGKPRIEFEIPFERLNEFNSLTRNRTWLPM